MRIAELAERAGHAGVHVTFKIDGLRERNRWTVILGKPPFAGEFWVTRSDLDRIDQVLDFLRRQLITQLGEHEWLDEPVEDADGFADVMEEIGATGAVLLVDHRPETRWRLTATGVQRDDYPTLDACLLDGYDRVLNAPPATTKP
ncbi:hypothetical protein BBK82_18685 [Lentzea guizhouensis]|uniref:Uncharacterized protein n=1 Tax=Lentzea guizhouensis TaxID=1586287 RepID=A0A1B2HJ95_9PSEU|nr:hypothetical protein [Lentzea guizhouensis]ANZ37787.1 hypothetical protein BBK82_18685 [Lentzea guizhouensis]